jgi:hypothetical protein
MQQISLASSRPLQEPQWSNPRSKNDEGWLLAPVRSRTIKLLNFKPQQQFKHVLTKQHLVGPSTRHIYRHLVRSKTLQFLTFEFRLTDKPINWQAIRVSKSDSKNTKTAICHTQNHTQAPWESHPHEVTKSSRSHGCLWIASSASS